MNRVIFHIDVNSAYLSWTAVEQLKSGSSLDIRTIPAIIGGDRASRHGVVLAKIHSCKEIWHRYRRAGGKCAEEMSEPPYGAAGSQDVSPVQPGSDGVFENIFQGDRAGQCGRVLHGFYRGLRSGILPRWKEPWN